MITPPDPDASAPEAQAGPGRGKRLPALLGFLAGLGLLGVGAWAVARNPETLSSGLRAISAAPAWAIALALGLYMLNFVFASGSFWVLTNRYGRVRYPEMFALIAAATLLNYLPLRPGMLARVGFHRAVHGIAVKDSIKVLVQALAAAAAAMGALVLLAWIAHASGLTAWRSIALLALPLPVGLSAAAILRSRPRLWRWPVAACFRYLDMATWTARYALIFWILGRPQEPPVCAAVAAFSQGSMLSPVQLGLREWVVGIATGVLEAPGSGPAVRLPDSLAALTPGLLADMMNRAAEFMVAIPLGLVLIPVLWLRLRRATNARSVPRPDSGPACKPFHARPPEPAPDHDPIT